MKSMANDVVLVALGLSAAALVQGFNLVPGVDSLTNGWGPESTNQYSGYYCEYES